MGSLVVDATSVVKHHWGMHGAEVSVLTSDVITQVQKKGSQSLPSRTCTCLFWIFPGQDGTVFAHGGVRLQSGRNWPRISVFWPIIGRPPVSNMRRSSEG